MLKVLTWPPVWISVWLSQLLFNFCSDGTAPWGQILFALLSLTLKVTSAAQNSELKQWWKMCLLSQSWKTLCPPVAMAAAPSTFLHHCSLLPCSTTVSKQSLSFPIPVLKQGEKICRNWRSNYKHTKSGSFWIQNHQSDLPWAQDSQKMKNKLLIWKCSSDSHQVIHCITYMLMVYRSFWAQLLLLMSLKCGAV